MNAQAIKEFILNNDLVETTLMAINCRHVKDKGDYFTCGNYDGDNVAAITVYKNDNLTVVNYTRNMVNNSRGTDIFDLISYNLKCSFFKALQFVCDLFGLDYYQEIEKPPESLQLIQLLDSMSVSDGDEANEFSLTPINQSVLKYYLPYPNKMWSNEGISLTTQNEFGVMYDPQSNRIILPLYDELENLVGIKGRLMTNSLKSGEQKYLYMTRFNKSRYIFGLNKTYSMIQQQGYVVVFESEKSVMLAYEHGIGAVSICGCKMSKYQVDVLTRLNTKIILALDKDRIIDDIEAECDKFLPQIPVWYIYDKDNILNEKESPIDNWDKFQLLKKNNTYKFRKENFYE